MGVLLLVLELVAGRETTPKDGRHVSAPGEIPAAQYARALLVDLLPEHAGLY